MNFAGATSYGSRLDACVSATVAAKTWVKNNTDPSSGATFEYNQARRRWSAKLGGISKCDCEKNGEEKTGTTWKCTVDAEIVSK